MIRVNGKEYPWEGVLTVKELLDKMRFTFPLMAVAINGKAVSREEYAKTLVRDGDDVKAIHLISGG
ncbi:MAG: sulfur carrier protein ThiS [Desulfitobacteriaceae bacterium]